MKTERITSLLTALLLAVATLSIGLNQAFGNGVQEHRSILITQQPPTPEEAPRSTPGNPFSAELYDNAVSLFCSTDCGDADVVIYSTAGDYQELIFDTAQSVVWLPISGMPGDYSIVIVTEDGRVFLGEFSI